MSEEALFVLRGLAEISGYALVGFIGICVALGAMALVVSAAMAFWDWLSGGWTP